ncbi:hypothetical protein N177_1540 [Lutibaculum baratangense AMV1]|uniref:EamA domain-containing protein n=2 Tax=Lutibaculum TaxID=1358438 RepID=V4R133_9HYPH|nr:hypothetical protein N177_1540 [Lutibaculum baratangense AMV1]
MAGDARTELGMTAMVAAMLVVPVIDAIAKHLGTSLSPTQIACLRFVFQTAILLPLALGTGRPIRSTHWRLHAARGAFLAGAMIFLIWAFQHLPLANAIAIFFVEPLILTLLSFVVLGERFGPRRLAAVVVGLVGALVVIRPNWAEFGAASILPLGAATCFACYLALTRRSAAHEDPICLQLWAGIFATGFLAAALVVGGTFGIGVLAPAWPGAAAWGWLAAMGLVSAVTHVLIGFAFQQAPASTLAPFQYLEIISATALGFLVFGDFPDALTWFGTAIIVAAGIYVFMRERRLARG